MSVELISIEIFQNRATLEINPKPIKLKNSRRTSEPKQSNRLLALDMTSHPASATLAIVAFCTTALFVFQQQRLHMRSSRATSTDTPAALLSARDRLIGAWVLTSYHVDDATTGARQYPLGHDAKGIIVSSSSVKMFCILSSFSPSSHSF